MKKKIVYKLTDENGQTKGETQWGENVSHTATGTGEYLCSSGWIHYYTHPLLAVFLNPIHANFYSPKLWEAEASGKIIDEALKSGCKTLRTIKEIPLPEVTLVQKIAFAILCGKEVYKDKKWNLWADKWLSGEDTSKESAAAASSSAAAYYAAADAAHAAHAAHAVRVAVRVACAAYYAADAAAYAADKSINFIELAEKAMTYK